MSFGCNFVKLYLMIVNSLFYSDGDSINKCSIRKKGEQGEYKLIVICMLCESRQLDMALDDKWCTF